MDKMIYGVGAGDGNLSTEISVGIVEKQSEISIEYPTVDKKSVYMNSFTNRQTLMAAQEKQFRARQLVPRQSVLHRENAIVAPFGAVWRSNRGLPAAVNAEWEAAVAFQRIAL
jgi:hypothetical protein